MNRPLLAFVTLLSLSAAAIAQDAGGKPAQEPKKAEAVDFEKQVWPILEKNCLECHSKAAPGPDGKVKKPKGGVVLDSKDAISGGKKGKLLVAKKSGESLLYTSI
ncbi:MAG: c-type cytochrome domain-containing protein, partial [Planctomycetota bacterium]